jgi:hypothetical protein
MSKEKETLAEALHNIAIVWRLNDPMNEVRYNRIRAALEEYQNILDAQEQHGEKPEPSGLEKLDDKTGERLDCLGCAFSVVNFPEKTGIFENMKEYDRLLLEEVDRRIEKALSGLNDIKGKYGKIEIDKDALKAAMDGESAFVKIMRESFRQQKP